MTIEALRSGRSATFHDLRRPHTITRFVTTISLHAHSYRSCERMTNVPFYVNRIPVISHLVLRELRQYLERNGEAVDFAKSWWHPPVRPDDIVRSETTQIEHFGLQALVSIRVSSTWACTIFPRSPRERFSVA